MGSVAASSGEHRWELGGRRRDLGRSGARRGRGGRPGARTRARRELWRNLERKNRWRRVRVQTRAGPPMGDGGISDVGWSSDAEAAAEMSKEDARERMGHGGMRSISGPPLALLKKWVGYLDPSLESVFSILRPILGLDGRSFFEVGLITCFSVEQYFTCGVPVFCSCYYFNFLECVW